LKKLSKDDIHKLRKEPGIIPGIHNYCDRWCEKCPGTQHCMVFVTERAFNEINTDEPDALEDQFAFMENMFEITHALLEDMAAKHGIDLDDLAERGPSEAENEFDRALNHPLSKKGDSYCMDCYAVLEENSAYFNGIAERQLMIFGENEESKILSLTESFETIRWYCTLLPAKLVRAMGTFIEDDPDDEFTHGELYGTLKVAIISTQRSMVAWAKVLEYFPDKEDEILPLLVTLEQICKIIMANFPQTLLHKRPGLDD
jgi:hypothetical protein